MAETMMEKTTQTETFFGGLPTDIEVRKLKEEYPMSQMAPGKIMPYADLEHIIGAPKHNPRFHTVLTRWRAMVTREVGQIIDPIGDGTGMKVLNDVEKLDRIKRKKDEAKTKINIAIRTLICVDRNKLGDEHKIVYDFEQMNLGKQRAMLMIRRQIKAAEM